MNLAISKAVIDIQKSKGTLLNTFTYPGGETQVRLTEEGLKTVAGLGDIYLVSRITNAQDIVETVLAVDAVFHHADDNAHIQLVLPYLPYSRADRRFTVGDCFGLRGFLRMLRTLPISHIRTLDVHSAVATDLVVGADVMSVRPDHFIKRAMLDFARHCNTWTFNVLFPDEGARRRYSDVEMYLDLALYDIRVYHCSKRRDPATGKLSGFDVPKNLMVPTLIIDDICDGGGTFLGIAEQLPRVEPLGLYVTHGIFSKGLVDLGKYFKKIYTTDSFPFTGQAWVDKGPLVETFDCLDVLVLNK